MEDLHQNDEEQTTINDLIDSMMTYLGESGSMPYSFTYMKDAAKLIKSDIKSIIQCNIIQLQKK